MSDAKHPPKDPFANQSAAKKPVANPSPVKVAGVCDVELSEAVYKKAKLQNKIRWAGVFLGVVIVGIANQMGYGGRRGLGLGVGACVLIYWILSQIMPLANLTGTARFKKYGDHLRMERARAKLGIGDSEDS